MANTKLTHNMRFFKGRDDRKALDDENVRAQQDLINITNLILLGRYDLRGRYPAAVSRFVQASFLLEIHEREVSNYPLLIRG